MYRLLKCKSTNFQNLRRVGSVIAKNTLREENDLISQKYYNFTNALSRRYCINTIPEIKPRKVRKRRTKKYADILIVTSNSASEGRVTVKNINSKNIELLRIATYLNKFFDEKPIETTSTTTNDNVTNYLRVSSAESGESALVEDGEKNENSEDAFEKSTGVFDPASEEIPDNVEPKVQESLPPKPYKREVDFRIMRSQFELRSFLEKSHQNLYKMQDHRDRTKKDNLRNLFYQNVDLYNELLRGLAGAGHYKQIEDVIKCAEEDEVELNAQSFASIFECLGRRLFKENFVKEIRNYTKELHKQGLTFDDMMNKAIFFKDDREMVLKAIRAIEPDYSMTLEKPDVHYVNDLVNHLNREDQLDSSQYLKKNVNNGQGLFTGPILRGMIQDQLQLERDGYMTIKNIQSEPAIVNDNLEKHNEARKEILKTWEKQATDGFKAKYEFISNQHRYLRLKPYLALLPVKDYVQIILNAADAIASGSDLYCPSFQQLHRELGYRVYNKYCVLFKEKQSILDKIIKIHEDYCDQYADRRPKLDILPTDVNNVNDRQRWQMLEYLHKADGATALKYQQDWPPNMITKVGEYLYNIMVQYLRINVNIMEPDKKKHYHDAFYITSRQVQYRMRRNAYKPHTKLKQIYNMSVSETLRFPTNLMPMKCPPVPWSSFAMGGYLVAPCDLVRLHYQADMQRQKIIKAASNTLYPILDSLNQLSAVPWRINNNILDLILQVFKSGGSNKLNVPTPPSAFLKAQDKNLYDYNKEKLEMYSLWCDCLYRLSVANHFRNDVFWLPHNLDFRGRVYPIPPHLNHLGADLARSMLVFAEERPLGPKGLDWLKIHLINLTGLKKRSSIRNRLAYANEIMDDILDSADKPLNGKMWWAKSDDPWQTLACCMEIAAAHRSPNPTEFRSGFPIHQDGSCNGLQHYAALGRDSAGAFSVNLKPDGLPQDVYTTVVDLVEERRMQDAKAGNELAKSLEGFVKRKIIKQTIMTTVYGVTEYGARLQIQKQLKALDNFPREDVVRASNYLSKLTFRSLTSMFTSSKAIQDWLTNCARYIVSVKRKQVEWVTPLGLPVVQPYSNKNGSNWNVSFDSFQLPDARKQKNAFAPNFIHSLDSSHMMLTSLHSERAGIVFVSVHDCFWTHPATVAIMNQICREQFVALHSRNILEDLSMFFFEKHSFDENEITKDGSESDIKKYKLNVLLKNLPKTGNFDINEVLNSTYFFS